MWNRQSTQMPDAFRKQPKKDSRGGRPSFKRAQDASEQAFVNPVQVSWCLKNRRRALKNQDRNPGNYRRRSIDTGVFC